MTAGPHGRDTTPTGSTRSAADAGGGIHGLVDHLFRARAGQMVASLVRVFGADRLQLAEDVVQEALLRALRTWPFAGVPADPGGWLFVTAKRLALDAVRRSGRLQDKRAEIAAGDAIAAWADGARRAAGGEPDEAWLSGLRDDQLRLVFLCCHPELRADAQVALVLKTLGGFGTEEIARAFLTAPATVAQRLVRAKRRLREAGARLEVPGPDALPGRLDSVLASVYLLFNEGYAAHRGEALVREDLLGEALRLGRLLVAHPATARPEAEALLALMLLHAARTAARVGADGELALLTGQDRSRWDRALLAEGFAALDRAARGDRFTAYHGQAAIAAAHASAPSWEATDWPLILEQYERLAELTSSPVVTLNRAVARGMVHGPDAALAELDALVGDPRLARYALLPAMRAEFLARAGRASEAAAAFDEALARELSDPERRLLEARRERVAG